MGVAWMSQYEADKLNGTSKPAAQVTAGIAHQRVVVPKPAKPNRK
jgi:hypothetical protein